jgi:hypothetical protein
VADWIESVLPTEKDLRDLVGAVLRFQLENMQGCDSPISRPHKKD